MGSISNPALKTFATAFMKSGNVNLINGALEVLHASGYKIDQASHHVHQVFEVYSQIDNCLLIREFASDSSLKV